MSWKHYGAELSGITDSAAIQGAAGATGRLPPTPRSRVRLSGRPSRPYEEILWSRCTSAVKAVEARFTMVAVDDAARQRPLPHPDPSCNEKLTMPPIAKRGVARAIGGRS